MKTYEIVRELVKMIDDNQPKQKAILWPAFTQMFDLMIEEYEEKKTTAAAVRADKVKAAASPVAKSQPKGKRKSYQSVYNHFSGEEATK